MRHLITLDDLDQSTRDTLLAALGIFGELAYEPQLIKKLLPEGIMQKSPLLQLYIQEAEQEALKRGLERGLDTRSRTRSRTRREKRHYRKHHCIARNAIQH